MTDEWNKSKEEEKEKRFEEGIVADIQTKLMLILINNDKLWNERRTFSMKN